MEDSFMLIFVTFIIIALMFYIFYKIKYFSTKRPIEKRWLSSKSSISLGIFVALCGINQLFVFPSTITYMISIIFILIGTASTWNGVKAYKFYLPLAIDEAKQFNQKTS